MKPLKEIINACFISVMKYGERTRLEDGILAVRARPISGRRFGISERTGLSIRVVFEHRDRPHRREVVLHLSA